MLYIFFKGLSTSCFEIKPLMLNEVPKFLDSVQFRAVGRQEIQGDALFAQQFKWGWIARARCTEALSKITMRGKATCFFSKDKKADNSAAVMLYHIPTENREPLLSKAPITLKRLPRFASI